MNHHHKHRKPKVSHQDRCGPGTAHKEHRHRDRASARMGTSKPTDAELGRKIHQLERSAEMMAEHGARRSAAAVEETASQAGKTRAANKGSTVAHGNEVLKLGVHATRSMKLKMESLRTDSGRAMLLASVAPMLDMVSDILVCVEWFREGAIGDGLRLRWAKIGSSLLGVASIINLYFFWYRQDYRAQTTLEHLWHNDRWLNAAAGFGITALNLRAQAVAWILIRRLLQQGEGVNSNDNNAEYDFGLHGHVTSRTVVLIQLVECACEAFPQLVLQLNALAHEMQFEGNFFWNSSWQKLMSIVIGFVTLVFGYQSAFLWANTASVKAFAIVYISCMMFSRFAMIVLFLTQFGSIWFGLFLMFGLAVRSLYVWVSRKDEALPWADTHIQCVTDPLICYLVPIGRHHHEPDRPRLMGHMAPPLLAEADSMLYSYDAMVLLRIHTLEVIGAVALLMTTTGYQPSGICSDVSRCKEIPVRMYTDNPLIILLIVVPYALALLLLAVTAALHKFGSCSKFLIWLWSHYIHPCISCNEGATNEALQSAQVLPERPLRPMPLGQARSMLHTDVDTCSQRNFLPPLFHDSESKQKVVKVLAADNDWLDGKKDTVEVVAADDEWQLVKMEAGAPTYYNVRTGATRQEKPQPEWQRLIDNRTGSVYWYNTTTGESQWETRTATSDLI